VLGRPGESAREIGDGAGRTTQGHELALGLAGGARVRRRREGSHGGEKAVEGRRGGRGGVGGAVARWRRGRRGRALASGASGRGEDRKLRLLGPPTRIWELS